MKTMLSKLGMLQNVQNRLIQFRYFNELILANSDNQACCN